VSERSPVAVEASHVSGTGQTRTAYSWGEVVAAAVIGRTVAFYEDDTQAEVACYRRASEAHAAALAHAQSFEDARQALAVETRP
jgi:RNase P/RNase MRP subunit POP5